MKTVEILGANRFETFSKTRDGARAIIVQDGNILLTHELNSGWWLLPGGGQEEGETFEECVIREVEEETGVLVRVIRPVVFMKEYYEEYCYSGCCFACEVTGKGHMNLTEAEIRRGVQPEWIPLQDALELFSKHESYADISEEKRGSYQREYIALKEYMESGPDSIKGQMYERFPGVSCAYRDAAGREILKYTGVADKENGVAVDRNTVFPACSISKFITAITVMKLQEQELLNIDEPVNRYLHQWKLRTKDGEESDATIRSILNHTSELWSTPEELMTIAKEFFKAINGRSTFLSRESALEMIRPTENFSQVGLGLFLSEGDILLSQGWGENGQSMLKLNTVTGEISVVMTNKDPGVDQTESGLEHLATL